MPRCRIFDLAGKQRRKQLSTDGFFRRKPVDVPSYKTEARVCSCLVLFVVGAGSRRVLMRLIVEFDRYDYGGVLPADNKVVAESVDAIVPFVEVKALFHAEYSRYLNLRQDDVLRQGADETVVKNLFGLTERLAHIKGPPCGTSSEESEALE